MIKIRQHTPTQLKLYKPDGPFVEYINNQVESLNVRLDIAKNKLTGYYFMHGQLRITITENGSVENWPSGLYNETSIICRELYNRQLNDTNNQ